MARKTPSSLISFQSRRLFFWASRPDFPYRPFPQETSRKSTIKANEVLNTFEPESKDRRMTEDNEIRIPMSTGSLDRDLLPCLSLRE